ncbi:MAG: hypothetical protein HY721_02160 [Planctomycetes bacterium]|nr:hypothetical protein [Planctomycetota bacterium]
MYVSKAITAVVSLCVPVILSRSILLAQATDASQPGSLSVTLTSAEGIPPAASWRVPGRAWRASEQVEAGLPAGWHVVEFLPIFEYEEPKPLNVLIVGGQLTQRSAAYSPIPSYSVGSIPDVEAWQGRAVRFFVVPDPELGKAASVAADLRPQGPMTFDPARGLFAYDPSPEDRKDFSVSFLSGSGSVLQTVTFAPLAHLPPEETAMEDLRHGFDQGGAAVPDPEGRDYVFVTEELSAAEEDFNLASRKTRIVTVSGRRLLFEKDTPKNALHTFDGNEDIREMRIYAETVVIRSPLRFPQTRVVIVARELRFEDRPGSGDYARIDTTPGNLRVPAAEGKAGKSGLKAGDILLRIERFHADPSPGPRFILRGGNGQAAGAGRDGESAASTSLPTCDFEGNPWPGRVVYHEYIHWDDGWDVERCGAQSWPADGADATPPGKPGEGGPGGTFFAPAAFLSALVSLFDLEGGKAGAKAKDAVGGEPGTPIEALWVRTQPVSLEDEEPPQYRCGAVDRDDDCVLWVTDEIIASHTATRGADAPAPSAIAPFGPSGAVLAVDNPESWLHPSALRSLLVHVKDAYLQGSVSYVKGSAEEYAQIVSAYETAGSPSAPDFQELGQEVKALVERTSNHLDYYGNPLGWVPMLSFEVNYAAFRNEIEIAMKILHLAYVLEHARATVEDSLNAMRRSKQALEDQNAALLNEYVKALEAIPGLEAKLKALMAELEGLQSELLAKEAELVREAGTDPRKKRRLARYKKALGALSGLLKVVPVAQPLLGVIGGGLDFVSSFLGTKEPLEAIQKLPGALESFNVAELKKQAEEFKKKIDGVDLNDPSKLKELAGLLKPIGEKLGGTVEALKELRQQTEIPKSELEAELAKIKAKHPELKELADKVKAASARKETVAKELAGAIQTVTQFTVTYQKNLVAIDGIHRSITEASGKLNHEAFLYLKDVEQRTKARLLKYQYYLAKAYEYRVLEPYPGNLQLPRLLESFIRLRLAELKKGPDDMLSYDEFDEFGTFFHEELQHVAFRILERLNENPPLRRATFSTPFSLEELRQLNEEGAVKVNLAERGIFGLSRENIRIVDLRTHSLSVDQCPGEGRLELTFTHGGTSRLVSGGQPYVFHHYRNESVRPIVWETFYRCFDGSLDHSAPSPANDSLIRALVGYNRDILLYSLPGAWAEIEITKVVQGVDPWAIAVESLRLEVEAEYAAKPMDNPVLQVEVGGDLKPSILLDLTDAAGRKDGRGGFLRVFSSGTRVRLEAEPTYGELEFAGWAFPGVGGGGALGTPLSSPILEVHMTGDKIVRAVYRPVPAPGPSSGYVRGDANADGSMDISDPIAILLSLFLGGSEPLTCPASADANADQRVDISDASFLLSHLFLAGRGPPPPSSCGEVPPPGLPCEGFDGCR